MSATAYTGLEAYAYVAYPREDRSMVQAELDRLEDLGVRIYFPALESNPTDPSRLSNSAFVLILVSDSVADDASLRREVSSSLQEGKEVLAVHLVDVPLDGAAKLLLSSVSDLRKYDLSDDEYLRRLVRLLPDEVKARPIDLPGPEAPPPMPASTRPAPTFQEKLKDMGTAQLGMVAGAVVVAALLLFGMIMTTTQSTKETKTQEVAEEGKTEEADAEEIEAIRKQRDLNDAKRKAERKAKREAAQKARDAKVAVQNAVSGAAKAFEKGDAEKTVELLAPAFEHQGASPKVLASAHWLRGQAYTRLGKYAQAEADYTYVLKGKPDHHLALEKRGAARLRQDNPKGAVEDLSALVKLRQKDDFAWLGLGDAQMALKDYSAAVESFTQAIALRPKSPNAYTKRSKARLKAGDKAGSYEDTATAQKLRSGR
jgi:tetratricopeptide (TPR) repeat protein